MSTLVVIEYNDVYKAEETRLLLRKLQKDYLLDWKTQSLRSRTDKATSSFIKQ